MHIQFKYFVSYIEINILDNKGSLTKHHML